MRGRAFLTNMLLPLVLFDICFNVSSGVSPCLVKKLHCQPFVIIMSSPLRCYSLVLHTHTVSVTYWTYPCCLRKQDNWKLFCVCTCCSCAVSCILLVFYWFCVIGSLGASCSNVWFCSVSVFMFFCECLCVCFVFISLPLPPMLPALCGKLWMPTACAPSVRIGPTHWTGALSPGTAWWSRRSWRPPRTRYDPHSHPLLLTLLLYRTVGKF